MSILRHQADVSGPVPLPTDRVDDASTVTAVSGETLAWYYVNSAAWASATGQAAGTIVTGKLAFSGVLNSMKSAVGTYNDTSLSFAAATRAATKVSIPEDVLSQMVFMTPTEQSATAAKFLTTAGYYAIDHRRGQIWLKSKDTVANDSVSYSYMAPVAGSGGPSTNVAVTSIVPGTGATNLGKAEDAAHTTGDTGVQMLAVRKDAAAALAGADGDYAPLEVDANGKLHVNAGTALEGPGNPVIDSYATVAINLTTGANQVLVSSAADKQIWVYGYAFTVGDAAGQTVSLQDEDDTALTGIMEFAQYGGISVPPSGNFAMPVFKLATDKDLEIDITGGDVDGWLSFAIVSV